MLIWPCGKELDLFVSNAHRRSHRRKSHWILTEHAGDHAHPSDGPECECLSTSFGINSGGGWREISNTINTKDFVCCVVVCVCVCVLCVNPK